MTGNEDSATGCGARVNSARSHLHLHFIAKRGSIGVEPLPLTQVVRCAEVLLTASIVVMSNCSYWLASLKGRGSSGLRTSPTSTPTSRSPSFAFWL